jgi:3-methyladenine DNA glycosylase AlkD
MKIQLECSLPAILPKNDRTIACFFPIQTASYLKLFWVNPFLRFTMTATDIVDELKKLGKPTIKKVLMNHGAKEPFFGVAIGDMKKIQKKIKINHELALELYETGISDAMYFAGLIADDAKMTKKDLQRWLKQAYWYMLSEFTVPWVAVGSIHGLALAKEWLESKKEPVAAAGWCTYSGLISTKPNDQLDLEEMKGLVDRIGKTIHQQPNRVRYCMNGYIIHVGGYIKALSDHAIKTATQIGQVKVDMGNTECKVPGAVSYIQKMHDHGSLEKKKKTVKC